MKSQVVLLLALLLPAGSALAQAPHTPRSHSTTAALDPVGTYDINTDMHGQVTASVLVISREKDGSLKGTLEVHGQSMALDSVSTINHVVRLASGSDLVLTLTFKDHNALTGKWVRGDDSGTLTGTRRKR